jgi:hypothetical protein
MMICQRELLVSASQIQRGLPSDSHANTRRAVEVAKVALALKRNRNNAEAWLKADLRQRRWNSRQQGQKPEYLPPVRFPELDGEPLIEALQQYFGMASDTYVHFTPEFFGQQPFSQTHTEDGNVFIALNYFGTERDILSHAVMLCGLHVRILLVFDAVFDGIVAVDAGWNLLQVTFDQLAADLMRNLPPLPQEDESGVRPDAAAAPAG